MNPDRLEAIQAALRDAGIDGWLFYDFHHCDPIAYRVLGLDISKMTSRRWYYWLPAKGEPVKLAHKVEPHKLDSLPGRQQHYLPWTEMHAKLKETLAGASRVAMQYSPMCNIPYISLVDAGTVELIRSMGPEVVSSADLVQRFETVMDEAGFESHRRAGERVQQIKDEAFAEMGRALDEGRSITEYEIRELILSRFEQEGMTTDGSVPIVGFNDHPADPHFEPVREGTYTLERGDTILLDLWARFKEPGNVYYDVTWCGFAGSDPPERYVEIFRVVCEARDAALELVRRRFEAGETCHGHEVDEVCRDVVRRAGYAEQFVHRTGHSIGGDVHGTGANIDNLETKDDRRLLPGCCFSIEPGIYLEGQMAVRTEIDVFVTPAGAPEVCGPIQRELILI